MLPVPLFRGTSIPTIDNKLPRYFHPEFSYFGVTVWPEIMGIEANPPYVAPPRNKAFFNFKGLLWDNGGNTLIIP